MASKFDQWVSKRLGKENDFELGTPNNSFA